MAFPVECTLPYNPDDPSTHIVKQNIFRFGDVQYDPRPEDGRRIVEFPSVEMQQEAVSKGPAGFFVVPTDILNQAEEDTVRRLVEEILRDHGLISRPVEVPAGSEPQGATTQAVGLARERGIDLDDVQGTGPGGRITKGDVEAALAERE